MWADEINGEAQFFKDTCIIKFYLTVLENPFVSILILEYVFASH